MNRNGSILVIDDEEIMREILEALLTREGHTVRLAADAAEGLELARTVSFDAAIVDIMMPGMDGMAALDELKKIDDELPVLMITAFASVESAITAMKRGAFHYITKPFKNDEVLAVLRNALAQRRLVAENRVLRQNLQAHANRFGEIIGRSPRMKQVFDLIMQAAPSRTTILINGESGTGKELVARALHQNSARSDKAFITVNSGNLPPDLLESNLFGHVKGAFTGAIYPKKGLFELADKGTIFFDEIGNIPLETQAKLLRVIQEREFMRLGGVETIKVDVRIIAATNVELRKMMEEGKFREDLFYRLHVITVQLPALRERRDDVPLLAQHFLEKYGIENQKARQELTPEALDLLLSTTGRATCVSSRTSSSGQSYSPRASASTLTSCPTRYETAADSRCPSSSCRPRVSPTATPRSPSSAGSSSPPSSRPGGSRNVPPSSSGSSQRRSTR